MTATRLDDRVPALTVRLAEPRGFCAGVSRAIRTVEEALAHYGPPIYVRHEIVHNAHVVSRLRAMGAVFIEDIADAPASRPVIFSAHGSPESIYAAADARGLSVIDATCPLVTKVHSEIRRHAARGRHVLLVGHAGHPEMIGAIGQAPAGAVTLIESRAQAETASLPEGPLAWATQTTLSVDDTADIIAALVARRPDIEGPRTGDICYATTNRQAAVKAAAPGTDVFLVVGDPTSSNSRRLVETAAAHGAGEAILIVAPCAFDPACLDKAGVIGVSAGASAPEELVEDLLARIAARRILNIEPVKVAEERIAFRQPALA